MQYLLISSIHIYIYSFWLFEAACSWCVSCGPQDIPRWIVVNYGSLIKNVDMMLVTCSIVLLGISLDSSGTPVVSCQLQGTFPRPLAKAVLTFDRTSSSKFLSDSGANWSDDTTRQRIGKLRKHPKVYTKNCTKPFSRSPCLRPTRLVGWCAARRLNTAKPSSYALKENFTITHDSGLAHRICVPINATLWLCVFNIKVLAWIGKDHANSEDWTEQNEKDWESYGKLLEG